MPSLTNLAMALDPVHLLHACGITPDEWQSRVLRSTSPRMLLNCSRQSGKSLVTAALADHTAFYDPGSPILLLSPSLRQSQELFRTCLSLYRTLDRPIPAESESALRLELENGSRIISLPGKEGTVRGLSGVRLLIIDEASRVPDELYMAVRPMLAVSGGRMMLLSTPFGTRGFYWEEWKHRSEWDYYEVPAGACPRITPEFLAEEKRTMGEWWFTQEYGCRFLDAQASSFRAEDIDRIVNKELTEWIF